MSAIVHFETIPELFTKVSDHYQGKGRSALQYKDRRTKEWVKVTWASFRAQAEAMAGYLHSRGIRKGDRVAILSENRPEWLIIDQAIQAIGAINVSLYPTLPASQVAYIVKDSGSRLLFVSTDLQLRKVEEIFDGCPELLEVATMSAARTEHPDFVRSYDDVLAVGAGYWRDNRLELSELARSVSPGDLSALIYTSGTTGKPKGVMLTHRNLCSNVRSVLPLVPLGPDDHHLSFLPLCHSLERTAGYTAAVACGATISFAESIDTVSRNLTEVCPTVLVSVPRLFERVHETILKSVDEGSAIKKGIFDWAVATGMMTARTRLEGKRAAFPLRLRQALAHKLVFSKLHKRMGGRVRFAVSGGAALPASVGEFFMAAGITIIEGYGLTETAPVLTVNPISKPRYGTVGHVIPGVTLAIQRITDGHILGCVSGADYPTETSTEEGEILAKGPNVMKGYWNDEHATREAIDDNGWFHTGDVGRFVDGYLQITDRIKHMIVSKGGKNIYPAPIEDHLRAVPLIDQILIVGERREFLAALVVPNIELLEHLASEKGITIKDHELLTHPAVQQIFEQTFKTYSRSAASHEKIRRFRLLPESFSTENGLLTPTLKPRRRAIEAHFASLIDEMYNE